MTPLGRSTPGFVVAEAAEHSGTDTSKHAAIVMRILTRPSPRICSLQYKLISHGNSNEFLEERLETFTMDVTFNSACILEGHTFHSL